MIIDITPKSFHFKTPQTSHAALETLTHAMLYINYSTIHYYDLLSCIEAQQCLCRCMQYILRDREEALTQ